jgi:hypothetical protein
VLRLRVRRSFPHAGLHRLTARVTRCRNRTATDTVLARVVRARSRRLIWHEPLRSSGHWGKRLLVRRAVSVHIGSRSTARSSSFRRSMSRAVSGVRFGNASGDASNERQLRNEHRSLTRGARDAETAAHRFDAVGEAAKARTLVKARATDAVIADDHDQARTGA